ncbi:MAG: hypothetical protein IJT97_09860 [Bacteroidaceae bacterium]|nr:hypothetical protein [Bacteroidaceae bacterium]
MNLKTFSQWLSMFVVLMVAGVSNVFAGNKLYIDDFTVRSASDVEVAVNLDNEDAVCAFQADFVIPEGLTVTGCAVSERTAGNTIKGSYPSDNVYRIAMFNLDNAAYPGNTGAIAVLTLHVSPLFEGGTIEVKNIMLSSPQLSAVENVEGGVATVTVNNRIYIEMDVTSQFSKLTEESNWTTITGGAASLTGTWACPAVEVNGLGQKQVCEFYYWSCASVGSQPYTGDVLYQTVTGLAAGVYKIELYGAAAFTYDRGFGSTAFTGDLSVDKNADYNPGDKIEPSAEFSTGVTLYAESEGQTYGGEIPIYYAQTFPDGAAVVTLNGVEVGESGSVKIGMSKTSTSTNWHVIQLKSVIALLDAEEALAAAVARAEAIEEGSVPAALYQEVVDVVAANNKAYETGDEYKAAIEAIDAVVTRAAEYAETYAIATPILEAMKAEVESTNVYTEAAYQEYYGQWADKFDAGTLTLAEAKALQDPSVVTGWHAAITVDNFLLSAWDTNPDFQDAPYYINTWSVEGDNDGTGFHVPFFEYWTGDDGSLGERTLTATVEGLEAGTYEVSAWVRVRVKNGIEVSEENPVTGITFSANDGEAVDVAAGPNVERTQFYLDNFTATGVVGEDGVLKIQFNVAADNNISWLSFKNVKYAKVETPEPVATEYSGLVTVTMTQAGTPLGEPTVAPGTVTISSMPGSDVADITFSSITLMGAEVPNTTIEDVAVTVAEDGTVNYAKDEFPFVFQRGQMTVTMTGTLAGSLAPDATVPTLTMSVWQNPVLTTVVEFGPAPFKVEIANADFTIGEPTEVGICTYAKDMAKNGTTQFGAQAVEGWTALNQTDNMAPEEGSDTRGALDQKAGGLFAYGSEAWLGGAGFTAPATNPEGQAEGQALGLIAVWGGDNGIVQYTQDITLPAGEYMLEVPVYNAGGTTAFTKNLIGVDETFATATKYPVGQWTIEEVKFTLEEEKTVTLSVGYASAGAGSNAMPHLFIDQVKILTSEEIAAAELATAKAMAIAAIQQLPVGTNVFYYDEYEVEDALSAIEAAEDVDAVKDAVKAVLAAQILPTEGVEYVIGNVAAGNNLSVVAPAEGEETGKVVLAEGAKVFFTAVEGGYVLSNAATEGEYIFKTTGNNWTLATTTNIEEAYVLNFNVVEGGYTIQGANGLFGTDNVEEGSAVYADKTAAANGVWTIEEYAFMEFDNITIACDGTLEYDEDDDEYYLPMTINYDVTLEGTYADPDYAYGLAPYFFVTFIQGEDTLGLVPVTPQDINDGVCNVWISGLDFSTEYKAVVSDLIVFDYWKTDWENEIYCTPIDIEDTVFAEVVFTTSDEPVEYVWTDLTDDMYHEWDHANTADAQITKTAPAIDNYDNKIGQGEVAAGAVVYGTSTVNEYDYAALAEYEFMKITFETAGAAPRLLFNRAEQDDHQGPLYEINSAENECVTASEDGLVWVIDLKKVAEVNGRAEGLVNLNTIKASWGGAVSIASIELAKVYEEPTELTLDINVERIVGQSYAADVIPFDDAEEAKEFLGVEELTYDMVRIVNPDGTEISDYAPYDGWFDGEGVATTWGSTTKICTKFFQVIPDGTFEICDMNGADEVGATYTTKWALVANDKKVFVNINVAFIAAPPVEIAVVDLGIKTSVEYDKADASYLEKSVSISEEDVQAILEELGLTSLDDADVYGYNPTTEELVKAYAGYDGWRNADGDFASWSGNATVPACVKYTDGQNYLCYNINGVEAQTIKTYWAIANEEKAVLVEIDFIYNDAAATGIAALEADGAAVEAVYSISGAKQNGLQKGLNVVKYANGQIKKVLVK